MPSPSAPVSAGNGGGKNGGGKNGGCGGKNGPKITTDEEYEDLPPFTIG